jgi:phosphopantothenoylcysteine decarboxylase/phosphopantothenate--cysteine ligase
MTVVDVETASQMHDAVEGACRVADVLIMAAAVADYRPAGANDGKIDKAAADGLTLELERTDDILSEVASRSDGTLVVGFAAEHGPRGLERAREKRGRKGVEILVYNDISLEGAGFGSDDNAVTILGPGRAETPVPLSPKAVCAERIVDAVVSARA